MSGFQKWLKTVITAQGILTHRGRVMHTCVSELTISGSDNGLAPGRGQAIIWTNAGIFLIRTLGMNLSEMLIKIHTFLFTKMHLKISSAKWRPFCLGLNVLKAEWLHVSVYRGTFYCFNTVYQKEPFSVSSHWGLVKQRCVTELGINSGDSL